ncbi:hypothetical protein BD410DRAFT_780504, partial [Rickenella mellea]
MHLLFKFTVLMSLLWHHVTRNICPLADRARGACQTFGPRSTPLIAIPGLLCARHTATNGIGHIRCPKPSKF